MPKYLKLPESFLQHSVTFDNLNLSSLTPDDGQTFRDFPDPNADSSSTQLVGGRCVAPRDSILRSGRRNPKGPLWGRDLMTQIQKGPLLESSVNGLNTISGVPEYHDQNTSKFGKSISGSKSSRPLIVQCASCWFTDQIIWPNKTMETFLRCNHCKQIFADKGRLKRIQPYLVFWG